MVLEAMAEFSELVIAVSVRVRRARAVDGRPEVSAASSGGQTPLDESSRSESPVVSTPIEN
jgi:hypothetical protein